MAKCFWLVLALEAVCFLAATPRSASAHGYVGDRFFPPTIATEDPFAVDELSFPIISAIKNPAEGGSPASREVDVGFELDKEILPHLAIGFSGQQVFLKPDGGRATNGWDNFSLSAKYQLWENPRHEAIISLGLDWDLGGTGTRRIGRDSFSTLTPTLFFGKGFGDLPASWGILRPFAITGSIGQTFPCSRSAEISLETGFAIEYSLPYLQAQVKDIGLPHPLKDLIPLVEFSFSTAENGESRGLTTGTINPGILWVGQYCQVGAEAIIPVNRLSGRSVGAVVNVQIFIDDLAPAVFGHPLFGE